MATSIKNIFDNQFTLQPISVKKINSLLGYENIYGASLEAIQEKLKPFLLKNKIETFLHDNAKIKNIQDLILEETYALIPVLPQKLYENDSTTTVEGDKDIPFHIITIVGFDDTREEFLYFDTLFEKDIDYTTFASTKMYKKIKYSKFTQMWGSSEWIYLIFYFKKITQNEKIHKHQKKLINVQNE